MRTREQIMTDLEGNRDLFEQLATTPEPRLSKRPAEDKWSIKETLCHLVDIQELLAGRMRKIAEEDRPPIELYDEERENRDRNHRDDDMKVYLEKFLSDRDRLIGLLGGLSGEGWMREGRHPLRDGYTIEFALDDMLDHEALHFEQIRQAP